MEKQNFRAIFIGIITSLQSLGILIFILIDTTLLGKSPIAIGVSVLASVFIGNYTYRKFKSEKDSKFIPYYLSIFILSFAFYRNSFENEYSMDDNLVTSTYESPHPLIEDGISAIPKIFTSHYAVNSKQSYAYRPVTTSSFAIEYQFYGQNPIKSHFFNVLLYALTIIVLFKVLNQMWGEEKYILTVLTCLIFLIHPLHTEVVDNIKSRDEILSLLFGLLSLKYVLTYHDRKKIVFLGLSFLFILLSLLSKKTGMIFIAIIPLTLFYFRTINFKKLGIVIGAIIIGLVVFKFMGKILPSETVSRVKYYFENPLYFSGFKERIPMYFYSNYYYLALLLFPYPLRYYYGYNQVPIADWSHPVVYIMLIFMIATVGISLWRIKKKEIWGFGTLFFFLGIGGACNLLFPAVGIIAERFAFIASVGFSITAGYGLYHFFFAENSKFYNSQKIAKASVAILSIVSLVYVFDRNKDWKNDVSLYKNDIEHLERSYKAYNLLGQSYYKEGLNLKNTNQPPAVYLPKIDTAEIYFKKCISIYADYAVTYNNLGALNYVFRNQQDTAYRYFEQAIALDSNYTEALFNLGNIESNRFYGYYFLNSFASKIQDTLNSPTLESDIEKFDKRFYEVGMLIQNMNNTFPVIINSSGNKSKTPQEFLTLLQSNVISYLTNLGVIQWLDQNELNQRFIENAQGIVKSYEDGLLNQHLHNFIGLNILSNILSKEPDFSKINVSSIASWSKKKMELNEILFLDHMKKCIELTPSYYPAFQSLNKYYYDLQNYDQYIFLNKKIASSGEYPYQYEFYNNLAKGYYFKEDLDSTLIYLNLTIQELDLFMKDEPDKAATVTQFKQGVINQLNHVNQLLNGSSLK